MSGEDELLCMNAILYLMPRHCQDVENDFFKSKSKSSTSREESLREDTSGEPSINPLEASFLPCPQFLVCRMATPPSTDIVDAIAHPTPPTNPTSDEKHGKTHGWKSGNDADEKKVEATIETIELRESEPKSRRQNYARSLRDFFSVRTILQCGAVLVKFGKFTGPGSIISVAYIDPDNFQTAISSGAEFEFKLLFMILVSNLIAIYLQVCAVPG
jgi:hypothetical protein